MPVFKPIPTLSGSFFKLLSVTDRHMAHCAETSVEIRLNTKIEKMRTNIFLRFFIDFKTNNKVISSNIQQLRLL